MKNPIATVAILIGCLVSLAYLRAERSPQPPSCCAKACECGCEQNEPCICKNTVMQQIRGAIVGGKIAPDGKEIQIDLPGSQHLKNKGGNDRTKYNPRGEPGKGLGLCVFTSIEHAARWQNIPALIDFRDWMTTKPGGGWPAKVDAMIAAKCKELNVTPPEYVQLEGGRELLDILRAALASNRIVQVTYSFSPTGRYGGGRIAHMVNLVHLDGSYACILDNNYIEPREAAYEWLTVDEFVRTFTGGKAGWAIVFLNPGPPPLPFN